MAHTRNTRGFSFWKPHYIAAVRDICERPHLLTERVNIYLSVMPQPNVP